MNTKRQRENLFVQVPQRVQSLGHVVGRRSIGGRRALCWGNLDLEEDLWNRLQHLLHVHDGEPHF